MPYSPASSSFPTSLTAFVDPTSTSDTDTFDHAGLESAQNDAIENLEETVGITGSADTASLNYKLTNTSSSNPGHKHTLANGATDVTASAAEVNVLDGMTSSTAELNVLDGIPATLTATELGYVDGVTSAIQTQLDAKQASDTDLTALAGLSTTGVIVRTGSGTATTRAVTGTANEITVTNGDGVSGAPTISIPAAVTLTGKTLTGGTLDTPTLTTPRFADLGYIADASGNEMLAFDSAASAVNYVQLENSATGVAPGVTAEGSDTNIDLALFGKGTGKVNLAGHYGTPSTYTPSAAATATLNLANGNEHRITMPAGNITIAIDNETDGQKFIVSITQDGVGSRTVTWFTTIRWAGGVAPTLTTTLNKRDVFGFICTGTDTYDGFVIGQNI